MDAVKELFNIGDKGSLLFTIIVLLVVIVYVIDNLKKLRENFGIKTRQELREEREEKAINELEVDLDELKKDFVQDCNNRDKYEIVTTGALNEIKNDIGYLKDNLQAMQDKQDAMDRSKLKDRIGQSYRHYHEKGRWNSMEKEAFLDLIKSYESANGNNSFVHEVCLPESETWVIVDDPQNKC